MKIDDKKEAALEAILTHFLENGLENSGIRTLAKSAGISDRMLIYYFASKDGLIRDVLDAMSLQTSEGLNLLIGEGQHGAEEILTTLEAAMAIPEFDNAMRLFLEVSARAARGIEPYRTAGQATIEFWSKWVTARLKVVSHGPSPEELLVEIEGRILLHLIRTG